MSCGSNSIISTSRTRTASDSYECLLARGANCDIVQKTCFFFLVVHSSFPSLLFLVSNQHSSYRCCFLFRARRYAHATMLVLYKGRPFSHRGHVSQLVLLSLSLSLSLSCPARCSLVQLYAVMASQPARYNNALCVMQYEGMLSIHAYNRGRTCPSTHLLFVHTEHHPHVQEDTVFVIQGNLP